MTGSNDQYDPYGHGGQPQYPYAQGGYPGYENEQYENRANPEHPEHPGGYQNYGAEGGNQPPVDPYAPPPAANYPYGQGGYDADTGQYPPYPQQPQQPQQQPQQNPYAGYGYPEQPPQHQAPQGYPAQQAQQTQQAPYVPQQPPPYGAAPPMESEAPRGKASYDTEQFAFVDDEEESSADVIDWLKFSETRGERRDERRRKMRSRAVWLVVLLVLGAAGGVGYLFATGKISLGGSGSGGAAMPAAQRQVISVYLRDLDGKTSTALLVDDPTAHRASTLLIPDTLKVPQSSGGSAVDVGDSWDAQSTSGTRDGLNSVLGTNVSGTWRLDAPFLNTLVDVLGGITVNADTAVVQNGKQLIKPGSQNMNGAAAQAYATYQAKGEPRSAQLARFGQVMEAVVKAFPGDDISASADVGRMGAVLDPSLPQKDLGAALAALASDAGKGGYQTVTLPVSSGGALGPGASATVQRVLGGAAKGATAGTAARVELENGSGSSKSLNLAQAAVQNAGDSLSAGSGAGATVATRATTEILYADPSRATDAQQLAQALGVNAAAAKKGTVPPGTDLLVELGRDYQG